MVAGGGAGMAVDPNTERNSSVSGRHTLYVTGSASYVGGTTLMPRVQPDTSLPSEYLASRCFWHNEAIVMKLRVTYYNLQPTKLQSPHCDRCECVVIVRRTGNPEVLCSIPGGAPLVLGSPISSFKGHLFTPLGCGVRLFQSILYFLLTDVGR